MVPRPFSSPAGSALIGRYLNYDNKTSGGVRRSSFCAGTDPTSNVGETLFSTTSIVVDDFVGMNDCTSSSSTELLNEGICFRITDCMSLQHLCYKV
ncbi:hypothetical protein RR46_10423 [Papilio xuthus]|uniref:Uncharacterized protein n=1 Tax=Papilio xuthus TaxID=66420 RepID=A0A194PJF0_PAPXU|nr:hypothetical protein RR46_10423 [Papilio xuthus]